MADNRTFFDRLFPDSDLLLIEGSVEESGTGTTMENGKYTRERWVKINGRIFFGADEALYQSSYGHRLQLVCQSSGRIVAYKNNDTQIASAPSANGVRGVIALAILLTAVGYFGGIWNFIWKGFDIWWLTIIIITFFSLYALVWTPVYAYRLWSLEKRAHSMLK
jgi:hypothetical protein